MSVSRRAGGQAKKAAILMVGVTVVLAGIALLALSGIGMIALGVAIIVAFSEFWVAGVSLGLAGVIGLATLHPRVADWVEEKALTGIDDEDNVPARTP